MNNINTITPIADLKKTFCIANTIIDVCFHPETVLPLFETLSPFLYEGPALKNAKPPIRIRCVDKPIDNASYAEYLKQHPIQKHLKITDNHYLFSFLGGQFLTDKTFSNVTLWYYVEKEYISTFDGFPWLQNILWGRLSLEGGCYLHGAIVVINGKYILLLGNSGVGKSTLSGLAVEAGFTRLTEENPFITLETSHPWTHATPWPGISGQWQPPSGKLHSIVFLRHAHENVICKIPASEAGKRLIHNARWFNWLPFTIPYGMQTLGTTINTIPIYDFGFVPDQTAIASIQGII